MNSTLPAILVHTGDAAFTATLRDYLSLHLPNPVIGNGDPQENKKNWGIIIADTGSLPPQSGLGDKPAFIWLGEKAPSMPGATLRLPLRLGQLLETVQRALAGVPKGEEMALTVSSVFLPGERAVRDTQNGRTVDLTEKEGEMLRLLAARRGEWIKGEELLKQVWGYGEAISTHTLQTHIYRLRQKIAPICGGDIIESAPGAYRLV